MTGYTFAGYLLAMAGTTYLIRALPFLLLRKKIENRLVLSALYYAPYAVLSAMTLPDILFASGSMPSALAGLLVALIVSYLEKPMVVVAMLASAAAIAAEALMLVL